MGETEVDKLFAHYAGPESEKKEAERNTCPFQLLRISFKDLQVQSHVYIVQTELPTPKCFQQVREQHLEWAMI